MPIQTALDSISQNAGSPFGFKNRIINGGMVIDQRNAGASVTPTDSQYLVDRWKARLSQSSKYTVQQNAGSVTPPVGFTNYLGVTSSSAYSVGSSDYFFVQQAIEGYNIADLAWGTTNAKPVTLSFWVRSSLTGTFSAAVQNSGSVRSYPFNYTISSANTWEQKSITIPGDTSGTWSAGIGIGIQIRFNLGTGSSLLGTANTWATADYEGVTGSVSVVGTNGATWYITGVQLEQGTQATSFDWRPYITELQLGQRYYFLVASGNNKAIGMGSYQGSAYLEGFISFPVTMRTTPVIECVSGTGYYGLYRSSTLDSINSLLAESINDNGAAVYNLTEASGTTGVAGWLVTASASAKIAFSAEL